MKFAPSASVIAAIVASSSLSEILAFSTAKSVGRTFVTRAHQNILPTTTLTTTPSSTLLTSRSNLVSRGGAKSTTARWLGSWFGIDPKIDYTALDHPGPELAKFAEAGIVPQVSEREPQLAIATFAGGCFWGLELAYQRVPGVVYTAAGYTQGKENAPTYGQVCSGSTGHTEAIIVYYNPKEVKYEQLLDTFFNRVNPTTVNGQGNDFGTQYRTGVYFHSPEQEEIARQRFEKEKGKYSRPIATELKEAKPFWPAEKYHQQYLEKGGRSGAPQSAAKGATDTIRCYG